MITNILKLDSIIKEICASPQFHNQESKKYRHWERCLLESVGDAYQNKGKVHITLDETISIDLPYHDMGNINTKHLFGIDEIIILSFYLRNKNSYQNTLDLGANIGLHSLVLNALNNEVTAYEADPKTFEVLRNNIELNSANQVTFINAAAASYDGVAEFTRVCDNLTGSHLTGAKENPYGTLEKFEVEVVNVAKHFNKFDLIKMDIEGQEADVFCSATKECLQQVDIMMEVNGHDNASKIFKHSKKSGVNLFVQNNSWEIATSLEHLPISHRDGSVFVSKKKIMPW